MRRRIGSLNDRSDQLVQNLFFTKVYRYPRSPTLAIALYRTIKTVSK